MKTEKRKYTLVGKNIYRDKSGCAIYKKPNDEFVYKIHIDQEGLFQTLLIRYYVSLVIGLLFYFTILSNITISVVIGVLFLSLMEYRYRKILNNCVKIEKRRFLKVDVTKKDINSYYKNETNKSLILKMLFFMIIGILLILNSLISSEIFTSKIAMFSTYLAAIVSFYFSYRIIYIYKIKNHKV